MQPREKCGDPRRRSVPFVRWHEQNTAFRRGNVLDGPLHVDENDNLRPALRAESQPKPNRHTVSLHSIHMDTARCVSVQLILSKVLSGGPL
jgi:hypothetical protein